MSSLVSKLVHEVGKATDEVTTFDNGDEYRGELNQHLKPHGSGCMISQGSIMTGLFRNGVFIHGTL